MDKAVSSPRPPPSFQGQGVPRGTNGGELFFSAPPRFGNDSGAGSCKPGCSMPAVNAASRPPRLDSMLRCPLPLNACGPVPSSALWNHRFVRDEQHRLCCIGAVHVLSWLAADKRPRRRVHSELIEKSWRSKESKRGPPGQTFHSPNLFCSFSVVLESLTGSTTRGQRPRMAGLKRTMLDLETGGMCANAAVRWRSQACVAACPWPYRSATLTTGEMSFSLASIQVPKPNGHS